MVRNDIENIILHRKRVDFVCQFYLLLFFLIIIHCFDIIILIVIFPVIFFFLYSLCCFFTYFILVELQMIYILFGKRDASAIYMLLYLS